VDIKDINREYMDLILNRQEDYHEDYKFTIERVKHSKARSRDMPAPFLYQPYFINEENLRDFKRIIATMVSINNKVTRKYIEDKAFRRKFGFPKLIEELIEVDNVYDINVPIGRLDIFYEDFDNFKFCEINTDGASGMNEDNALARILLETKGMKDFAKRYKLEYFELIDSWVDHSIDIYRSYDETNNSPNVAIVDFAESGITADFQAYKAAYLAKGYNCIIVDPRDLEYRDGGLYHGDYRIDLVYRRIVTFELIEKAEEIPDFIEAYRNQAFCCIGSIRSQVVHNKIYFKVLNDEDTLEILTEEERAFVKKHIPMTGIFGGDDGVFDLVLNNKDKFIMKPMDLNASQGVYVGKDLSMEEWEARLRKDWNNQYLYQEFVDTYSREYLVFKDGQFQAEDFSAVVGLFVFREEFAGTHIRIGQSNVISGVTDYYTAPGIFVDKLLLLKNLRHQ
jgi:glutathionylspermidine synthase